MVQRLAVSRLAEAYGVARVSFNLVNREPLNREL